VRQKDADNALVVNRSVQEGAHALKQVLLDRHRKKDQAMKPSQSKEVGGDGDEDQPNFQNNDGNNDEPMQRRKSSRKRKRRFLSTDSHNDDNDSSSNVDEDSDDTDADYCVDEKADIHSESENTGNEAVDSVDDNEDESEQPITEKFPPRNFSSMKKKDLVKLCTTFKLISSGSEESLRVRLRTFSSLWDAEIDNTIDPLRPSQVVAKLNRMERSKRTELQKDLLSGAANDKRCYKNLTDSISDNNKISSGNKLFDQKLNVNFGNMIETLNQRREANNESKTRGRKTGAEQQNQRSASSSDSGIRNGENDGRPTVEAAATEYGSNNDSNDNNSVVCIDINDSASSDFDVNNYDDTKNVNYSNPAVALSTNNVAKKNSIINRQPKTRRRYSKQQKLVTRSYSNSNRPFRSDFKSSPSTSAETTEAVAAKTWACKHCTFINVFPKRLCSMCMHRRIE